MNRTDYVREELIEDRVGFSGENTETHLSRPNIERTRARLFKLRKSACRERDPCDFYLVAILYRVYKRNKAVIPRQFDKEKLEKGSDLR